MFGIKRYHKFQIIHLPVIIIICILLLFELSTIAFSFNPSSLPQIGYHPGGIAYWDTPFFANALYNGGAWIEYSGFNWGTTISIWNNPQFDINGFPKYLNPGNRLRAITYALHSEYDNRPSSWPDRKKLAQGHIVLTWQGDADIRLNSGGTYLPFESTGTDTGRLINGKRVYLYSGNSFVQYLEIHDINSTQPITDIKVWLSDPNNPTTTSLEGQLYHPTFLDRLSDADWGFIRFMNFQETNANPQRDWSDRRPPAHCFMTGILNPRNPATGSPGDRGTGIAFEQIVELGNAAQKDIWINIPHMATDDFVTKFAKLIKYGSNGTNPYDTTQVSPLYSPLDTSLRVYIEYSNEIWSNGYSFPQGDWAQETANILGISKAQFNARRFSQIWHIFQTVFGDTTRLVRVAAVFTAGSFYTLPFLNELNTYGQTLSPPVEPDVMAGTTYFGNGMEDWIYEK